MLRFNIKKTVEKAFIFNIFYGRLIALNKQVSRGFVTHLSAESI